MNKWTNEWINEWMGEWMNERIWMDRWLDSWEDWLMDGWMDGWINCAIFVPFAISIMFWTDWGFTPMIERANMDGTGRTAIVMANLVFPNGLTIDFTQDKLYWVDANTKKVETSDLWGNNRNVILDLSFSQHSHFPFGLVHHDKDLYWTDWATKSLHRYNGTSMEISTVVVGISHPMGLVMFETGSVQQGSELLHKSRYLLTPSSPRVINFTFLLEPQQKYFPTQFEELGFSQLTQLKDDHTNNSHYLTYTFLFKRLGERTLWTWEWKGYYD